MFKKFIPSFVCALFLAQDISAMHGAWCMHDDLKDREDLEPQTQVDSSNTEEDEAGESKGTSAKNEDVSKNSAGYKDYQDAASILSAVHDNWL